MLNGQPTSRHRDERSLAGSRSSEVPKSQAMLNAQQPLVCTEMTSGYDGKPYLRNLSLEVRSGEIVGLIGANGSGKSTTIKTILGALPLMSGAVIVNGVPLADDPVAAKGSLGYVPEAPDLYQELSLWEYLRFVARIYGMAENEWELTAEQLLADFNMRDVKDHFPGTFSKGMKQKVLLLGTLLHKPQLYLIDEPFIGLDPLAIRTLVAWLEREKARGAGMLMSTHVLDSAEHLCDRFYVLHSGTLTAEGTLDELRATVGLPKASLLDIYAHVVSDAREVSDAQ